MSDLERLAERLAAELDVPAELVGGPEAWHWSALHEEEQQALMAAFPDQDLSDDFLPPEMREWFRAHGYKLRYETHPLGGHQEKEAT